MNKLTEQWKKGELPIGFYWYKFKTESGADGYLFGSWDIGNNSCIVEVLAEIPSYPEYQKLLSDQLAKQEGEEIIAELEHENLLLKVAVAELRSRLDGIVTKLEQAFYDDNVSFWDILVKIKKGLDK